MGIDLGTTNTTGAVASPLRTLTLDGKVLLPSRVDFLPKTVVGENAKNDNSITLSKLAIGKAPGDLKHIPNLKIDENGAYFDTLAGRKTPEDIALAIIKYVVACGIVENYVTPKHICITVPANFTPIQREIVKNTASKVCDDVSILTEPVAAALSYFHDKPPTVLDLTTRIMIFDVGAGTTDCAIVEFEGNNVRVLAQAGETVGGSHIDACIAKKLDVDTDLARIYKEDPKSDPECLLDTLEEHRAMFSSPILECMQSAGLTSNNLDYIGMVGGMTKIDWFSKMASECTGCHQFVDIDPFTAVAKGAAVQAKNRALDEESYKLHDVLPLSLGIRAVSGKFVKVLRRGTRIPCSAIEEFNTYKDYQEDIYIIVYEGERGVADYNHELCQLKISDFKMAPRGELKVMVEFKVDSDGLLHVSAWEDKFSKTKEGATVTRMICPERAREMVDEARENAGSDRDRLDHERLSMEMSLILKAINEGIKREGDSSGQMKNFVDANVEFMRSAPSTHELREHVAGVKQYIQANRENMRSQSSLQKSP